MFAHLERNDTVHDFQGSEICLIEFDELTHFTEKQFWYMLSRNRSTCGVRPYVRASTNPDPDSFVAKLIQWWWDPETGYAIPERSGVIRYFFRKDEEVIWGDSREELIQKGAAPEDILSFTFIASSLSDNKILMEMNPGYLSNLKALGTVERERLLYGNWKIRPAAGLMFKRSQIGEMLENVPDDVIQWVRCWDLAATSVDENGEAAFTAGVLMGKRRNGRYVVADVVNQQLSAEDVRKLIKNTAIIDKAKYKRVTIRLPQDPGQAGKDQAQNFIKYLSGFTVKAVRESGDKVTRSEPWAAQWQAGNFDVVIGEWNEKFFHQLEQFPEGKWKDMVDAGSNAFAELELHNVSAPPPANIGNTKSSYWSRWI